MATVLWWSSTLRLTSAGTKRWRVLPPCPDRRNGNAMWRCFRNVPPMPRLTRNGRWWKGCSICIDIKSSFHGYFCPFWGTVLAQQGQGAFSTGASCLPHLGTIPAIFFLQIPEDVICPNPVWFPDWIYISCHLVTVKTHSNRTWLLFYRHLFIHLVFIYYFCTRLFNHYV